MHPNTKIILELELKLTEAELSGDIKLLSSVISDNFLGITISGKRVDKSGFISNMCHSGIAFSKLTIEDVTIIDSGTIATAIGRSVFDATIDNRILSGSAQFMDVWQHLNGTWLLMASTVTPERSNSV